MAAGTVYLFIKNTGAPQYTIEWKPVSSGTWNPADMLVVNANGVNYTTATITVANTSEDYNIRIMAKCIATQANYYYIYLQGICGAVSLTAEWNNCICPEITNMTITE